MNIDLTLAICMYNAERYIEETLQSIMAQTIQNFHLLIVNDCSTDRSADIVRKFFEKNPRQYELVDLPVNGGLCAGRRYVEDNALTKYLLFVDSDDCPLPTLVEELYNKIISDKDLMAVGCYLEYMGADGEKLNGGIFIGEKTKEDFYRKAAAEKLIFMQPTAIYDREVALSVGGHNLDGFPDGRPRYRDLCEDLDLWTRMSDLYKDGKAIVVVPKVLCRYRKHESAMSADSFNMILRMRHIKTNLKRRRRGERELSFIEFREQIPSSDLKQWEREAKSANMLRNGYYNLRKGRVFAGIKQLVSSFMNSPRYFFNKLKHNLFRF